MIYETHPINLARKSLMLYAQTRTLTSLQLTCTSTRITRQLWVLFCPAQPNAPIHQLTT
ncbi:hypothetical protein HanXRQr2_Chr17g0780911 [Helianthus annuus]|uniref:Uncharacterized protein n=1 Tax=Helianthus annuus TaxID=4232 RepID=A0A9K3DDQ5_HELAN|nr:hypothetical protein HanXRQr2_Chr17g0780911 [Helianthus annuus]KAJ0811296.1 hypothetical protein HanPSC8_Chr17g0749151 [Helianthus annuus]